MKVALTIAGSDPCAGAGIQADLKTFTSLGVYGLTVITSVTVQNTSGVKETYHLDERAVFKQIEILVEDINIDAVKIGMLGNERIVGIVSKAVNEFNLKNVVLDTVFISSSGKELLNKEGIKVLIEKLIPVSTVVTPNIPEAEKICNMRIKNLRDMEICARKIFEMGAKAVVVKGGHFEGEKVIDLLYDGNEEVHYFVKERINKEVHGTGCTFASAICAFLAKGFDLKEAVLKAKEYTFESIKNALKIGKGRFVPEHTWQLKNCMEF